MHPAIQIITENKRGCGYRKPGGLYLRSDGPARGCGKLPIPLAVCPCCGEGIRPSRAPRMLQRPYRLWLDMACTSGERCYSCPLADGMDIGPALLVWIGKKFYPTPDAFTKEAEVMGISRRILSVPRDFEVGKTWVLLAHRKAIPLQPINPDGLPGAFGQATFADKTEYDPGIFRVFKPDRVEIVVTGDEPDEVIENYVKRGLSPVLIQKPPEPSPLPETIPMFVEEA